LRAALGEMSVLFLAGQRVVPNRALALGFRFRFGHLDAALDDLVANPRAKSIERTRATVYFNGDCPVCRFEMNHYAKLCAVSQPELTFIDALQRPDDLADCGLRREHLERRLYVRDTRGRVQSGMPAIIALWETMPRYRLLARVCNLPPLRRASVLLYDHLISPGLAHWARWRVS
jgi:uncharacterized protein